MPAQDPRTILPSLSQGDALSFKVKNSAFVDGSTTTYAVAGDILILDGIDGGYISCQKAKHGVTVPVSQLVIAAHSLRGDAGRAVTWMKLTDVVTTGATIGDPVYLSGTTAGAWTLTDPGTGTVVGKVLKVHATAGVVLLRPLV